MKSTIEFYIRACNIVLCNLFTLMVQYFVHNKVSKLAFCSSLQINNSINLLYVSKKIIFIKRNSEYVIFFTST